ncbi:hypothetical protein Q7C36_013916 [Tachysurus vachellii]|uniref:Uncharacterized protein n=1 Tax=Tachysurus vachellii TaxID=175792 RepID=A0AA88SMY7_TACVA|nr:hypothetical protein Q7C36_013916 [Tachysurus vachellii]
MVSDLKPVSRAGSEAERGLGANRFNPCLRFTISSTPLKPCVVPETTSQAHEHQLATTRKSPEAAAHTAEPKKMWMKQSEK